MFEQEAKGLQWLQGNHGLTIPKVIHCASSQEPPYLILEWLDAGPRHPKFDECLGTGLATLHLDAPTSFGWEQSNFIGSLPQSNQPEATWTEFYRTQRLMPQMERAIASNGLSPNCIQALERLLLRLEDLLPNHEPPARLHGDLWSGNVHRDSQGKPALIDPAVYGGHREMDLGMMKLFGGFNQRTFDAYHATYGLEPGWEQRVELNQLYPLLVHVNLFGGHYGQSVARIAKRYA